MFLSYASEDAGAAERICEALRAAGVEVWFDKSELRGGDAWDQKIRRQIRECRLFIPVISQHTQDRPEGYFRLEWKLAVDRSHLMAAEMAFLVPVVIDSTPDTRALVPDRFRDVQWTRLPDGQPRKQFTDHIVALLHAATPTGTEPVMADHRPQVTVAGARPPSLSRRRVLWAAAGAVVLALAVGAAWLASRRAPDHMAPALSSASEKSIAVLPFVDMSEKHDQDYFGDGMAEEILNLLVKIPDLKVIGRTSSFQFKGKTDDLRKIGSTLGASYLVEGSVRRSADHMRVTAQLIDTRDGSHRWSETYDRDAGDILRVQDEIAASLVRALQLELAWSDAYLTRSPIRSSDAYESYLRGLHAADRSTEQSMNEAIAAFQRALELDPAFVPAAEALALALFDRVDLTYSTPRAGFEEARAAAQSVLRLNPTSPIGHTVLAGVHIEFDWDWPAARREIEAAMSVAPHNASVLECAAQERIAVGQWNEAARLIDQAIAVDPLDADLFRLRAYAYLRLGRPADAENANRRRLEIQPTAAWEHYFLAMALLAQGRAEEALVAIAHESDASGRDAASVVIYQALHRPDEAKAAMTRLRNEYSGSWPIGLAYAYAALGDKDRAFEWLDKAYAAKDASLWAIKGHPYVKALVSDPRYTALLRRMNLPE